MTDRNVTNLLRGAMAPLVAIVLLAAFWLGVKALPRHTASLSPNLADSGVESSSESAPSYEVALPNARLAGDRSHSSPRSDLAQGSPTRSLAGKSDGSAATNGPLLILPPNLPPDRGAPAVLPPGTLASPLPGAQALDKRSEQLESIAREADTHSRYAFELASRGAVYAARAELIAALRLVAQGLDSEEHTTAHSRALAAGLTALKEVEDFVPSPTRLEGELNLAAIVASHRTPVLRDVPLEGVTALSAMQQYLTFCQEQLAAACGREIAGSMTLYGLGKLHAVLAARQSESIRAGAPKAMTFYQASLLVYPRNHMASNDLGVLLAQAGRFHDARVALEHSAALCRQEESCQNLAKVYRQLGQGQQAQYAEQQLASIRQERTRRSAGTSVTTGPVQWVDPSVMAQSSVTGPAKAQPGAMDPAKVQYSAVPTPPAKPSSPSVQGQPRAMSARLPNALFEQR